MNIGYVVFGDNVANHLQANFSILSAFSTADCHHTINVITDRPKFYAQLASRINIIEVNNETLTEWRGTRNYIYRIKIKAIETLSCRYTDEPVLYLDTDTFFYRKLSELKAQVNDRTAFMHLREGELCNIKWRPQRMMWKTLQHKTFAGVTINERHTMWNAGVVLLPGQKNDRTIAMILQLCDEILRTDAPEWLAEQFATSVVLSERHQVMEAYPWICHYWGHKPAWNHFLREFFAGCQVEKLSVDEQIERFKTFDFTSIPVSVRRNKGYQKITAFAEKLFPYRHVKYLVKPE